MAPKNLDNQLEDLFSDAVIPEPQPAPSMAELAAAETLAPEEMIAVEVLPPPVVEEERDRRLATRFLSTILLAAQATAELLRSTINRGWAVGQRWLAFALSRPSLRRERRRGLVWQLRRSFLALTLVPLFVAGLISIGSARLTLERQISREQTTAASQASLIFSAYIENLTDSLALFAKARDIGHLEDIALLDALRSLFNQLPNTLDQIVLLDMSGQELAQGTPFLTLLTSESVNWAGTDVFAATSTGQTYVASQPTSETDVLSATTIGVPVHDQRGEIQRVLVVTPNSRQMWREVSQVEVGQSGYVYVIDRHGKLVAYHELKQPVSPERLSQLSGVRVFVDETTPFPKAVGVYEGLTEQSVIGAYAPVADTPWAVIVELPTKEAFSALRLMMLTFAILFALVVVLATGAGSVLANHIVQPVLRLRDGALALGEGDLERTIEVQTGDEIEELGDAFNRMAQSLRASQAEQEAWTRELEHQVADRTRELQEMVDRQKFLLQTIWELSVPVVPVMEGVIVLPLVGLIDPARGQQVVESLMDGLKTHHARFVILDVTGVPGVDEEVARYLLRATRTTRLLGAEPILVGVTPAVAQALVGLSTDMGRVVTRTDLQAGVEYARHALDQLPFD